MTYQIMLSDEEYAALAVAAAQSGEPIEQLVHDAIMTRYAPASQPLAGQRGRVGSYQYPTGEPDSPAEEAEDDYLATSIGPGKPLSEILLDDRGPR